MSAPQKWKTVYDGTGAIRGQEPSAFWASDGPASYQAQPFTIWHCGRCGVNLAKDTWVCGKCKARNHP